jgi:glucuronate isomerase
MLHPDRLFPTDPATRAVARELYDGIRSLPILSPHGHTDPRWFAENAAFAGPAELFVIPDHYVFRMLCSQGVPLEKLGIPRVDGGETETDGRAIWRLFASNWHLFRATPSRLWVEQALEEVFGWTERLSEASADRAYDHVADCLSRPEFRPRALFERFGIEALSTTDAATDDLRWHKAIRESGWQGRVIPCYRPDRAVDPEFAGFATEVETLCELAKSAPTWDGYLAAHRTRRAYFKDFGATATDHGHPTACTGNLGRDAAAALFDKALRGLCTAQEAEAFRGQMLTEMAKMSLDDGLVMQIHPGSWRNHSAPMLDRFGRDKGFDIPTRTDYVKALKPLLDAVGMEPGLTVIAFTLDETSYGRELAPLAGVYPALKLGPPWWFFDSYEGMKRFREVATETAGIYNTVGFNDDTRAFCSIPARHDVARRVDCGWLATLVTTGRLDADEAPDVARDLTHGLAKRAYRL